MPCDDMTQRRNNDTNMFQFAMKRQLTVAASFVIALVTIVGPSSAILYRPKQTPPPPSYRNSQKNTGSGGLPLPSNHWSGSIFDFNGADLRQEWTSSPYCRNGVDNHETHVRKVSGAFAASKVRFDNKLCQSFVTSRTRPCFKVIRLLT